MARASDKRPESKGEGGRVKCNGPGGVLWGPVTSMQKPEGADRDFGQQDGIRPGMEEKGVRMEVGYLRRKRQKAVPTNGLWRSDWGVCQELLKISSLESFPCCLFLPNIIVPRSVALKALETSSLEGGCPFTPLDLGFLNFSRKASGDLAPCTAF